MCGPFAYRRRCPFANAVHGQDRRLVKGRGIERAGGVREVVLGKEDPIRGHADLGLEVALDPQLLVEPGDHRLSKDRVGVRKGAQCRHQDTLKLEQGLFVKDDIIQVRGGDASLAQAELDRLFWEAIVVLLAAEPFLVRY